jgi:hypothetical protein
MHEEDRFKGPYSYSFRTSGEDRNQEVSRATQETLVSIKDSLMLLTGECEITQHTQGPFCEKHGRPVPPGGRVCDYLATHFASKDSETRSKEQIQQYVSEMLGIKNPSNVRRLTGIKE